MNDSQTDKNRKNSHSEVMGWVRTGVTILSFVGSMYYFKGKVDAHIENREIHRTPTELNDVYVLRREYDNNVAGIKDDLRYMRQRLDMLIDLNRKDLK